MSHQLGIAFRVLGAIVLVGLALCCAFGFLASYELGFPNVWHFVYGGIYVAAFFGALWLVFPVFKGIRAGTASSPWTNYWRPFRWFALFSLFSLFSLFAIPTGNLAHLSYLMSLLFLMFLLPIPAKPRAQP